MKKLIVTICVLIIVAIIFFITRKYNDSNELKNNYYYLSPDEAMDVGFPEGAIIYKSTKKNVFSDIKIHGAVISMNFDEDFIIAAQQKQTSLETVKDTILSYFIINKKSDSVTGPLNKKNYLQRRKELGIPQELKLKEFE